MGYLPLMRRLSDNVEFVWLEDTLQYFLAPANVSGFPARVSYMLAIGIKGLAFSNCKHDPTNDVVVM